MEHALLSSFVPSFFRALGLLYILPFGEGYLNAATKLAIAVGMALFIQPELPAAGPLYPISYMSEFLIGICIGLPTALTISAFSMWGELMDTARGQNISYILDPLSNIQSPLLGVFMNNLAWSSAVLLGVLELNLVGYVRSFNIIAAGGFEIFNLTTIASQMLKFLGISISALLLFHLPVALLFLMIELALGYIAKVIPRSSFAAESFQIKSYLGLLMIVLLLQLDVLPSLLSFTKHGALLLE